MAVPIVACAVAPAAVIASSTNLSISNLLSLAALAANSKSGRRVNPAAAIRNFHATNAVPSSNEPATVVVRVYGTGLPPFGGTTIGLPYLSLGTSTSDITLPC